MDYNKIALLTINPAAMGFPKGWEQEPLWMVWNNSIQGNIVDYKIYDYFCNMPPILYMKTFQELTTDELYELLRVRSEVFVVEQNCVYQDLDGDDQQSLHLWLTVGEKVVAMARVCPAGTHMEAVSIGRVITTERGKGFGKQIMLHAIEAAVDHFGATLITIEAQEYAKGFYEGVGFKQSSETFMLDGIPHIQMTWTKG